MSLDSKKTFDKTHHVSFSSVQTQDYFIDFVQDVQVLPSWYILTCRDDSVSNMRFHKNVFSILALCSLSEQYHGTSSKTGTFGRGVVDR